MTKNLKAQEIKVPENIIDDLRQTYLGWFFGNKEETDHILIDVDWLLENEKDNPECDDVENAVRILTNTLGDNWRKADLLYLKGENSL